MIKECISALNDRLKITRGKLISTKFALGLKKTTGVCTENVESETENLYSRPVDRLPDIISCLQNETQLTRKSIVKILTGTTKLNDFEINPQKFIERTIDIINEQMRHSIIDGIKYKKIGDDEYYSQELFENQELFGYIQSNLQASKKSPYHYVVYDSKIESTLAAEFEKSSNISVYAKLPDWFKIETPLGTYNPDWAVLWKDNKDEKLFFVVESKGSTGLFDLRGKERGKIDCGKKHFKAIGNEMIVASSMNDVEIFALNPNYAMER